MCPQQRLELQEPPLQHPAMGTALERCFWCQAVGFPFIFLPFPSSPGSVQLLLEAVVAAGGVCQHSVMPLPRGKRARLRLLLALHHLFQRWRKVLTCVVCVVVAVLIALSPASCKRGLGFSSGCEFAAPAGRKKKPPRSPLRAAKF